MIWEMMSQVQKMRIQIETRRNYGRRNEQLLHLHVIYFRKLVTCMCVDRMVIKNATCTKRVQIKVAILTVPSEVISRCE